MPAASDREVNGVASHALGCFERAAILEEVGDAGAAHAEAADLRRDDGRLPGTTKHYGMMCESPASTA
jgi:hypothetical protein